MVSSAGFLVLYVESNISMGVALADEGVLKRVNRKSSLLLALLCEWLSPPLILFVARLRVFTC